MKARYVVKATDGSHDPYMIEPCWTDVPDTYKALVLMALAAAFR